MTSMFFYAGIGYRINVKGDRYVDGHHTVEDTAIVIGQALKITLGDKRIRRFAPAIFRWMKRCALQLWISAAEPFLSSISHAQEDR